MEIGFVRWVIFSHLEMLWFYFNVTGHGVCTLSSRHPSVARIRYSIMGNEPAKCYSWMIVMLLGVPGSHAVLRHQQLGFSWYLKSKWMAAEYLCILAHFICPSAELCTWPHSCLPPKLYGVTSQQTKIRLNVESYFSEYESQTVLLNHPFCGCLPWLAHATARCV